jgi:hypothetical protein
LLSEKALASASVGNDTNTLENATAALTESTRALQNAVQYLAQNNTEGVSDNLTLSIETSREKYAIGGPIHIFGNLTTTNGTMANAPIKITISPTSAESQSVINNITVSLINDTFSIVGRRPPIYQPILSSESEHIIENMTLNAINGSYSYRGLIPFKEAGIYQVSATTNDNKTALAFIEIVDLFRTASVSSIIAALGFFILLIGTAFWYGIKRADVNLASIKAADISDNKVYFKAEIGRFIALTGISLSLILALLFIDVEVNPPGPLGLVNISGNKALTSSAAFTEWGINVGGSINNNYQSGLIIPVYVIALGLIGGFMRYLHKALARTEFEDKEREEQRKRDEFSRSGFEHYSFGELSDILIAPILAIAVWFILHQEIQSVFLLAALSLTLGLATPNIISGLKQFATSTSGRSTPGSSTPGSSTPAGVG